MSTAAAAVPYWRLSSFYFLYFACLGVMVPYWSLYLERAGLGAPAIGVVLAVMAAVRIVAPNAWGWLADRSGRRLAVIRAGSVLSALSFSALLLGDSPAWVIAVVALHTFFWNAILAQYEVITLASLGAEAHRYGQVRVWGSVSFVLSVAGAGALFDRVGVEHFPWVMLVPLLGLAAGSFLVEDAEPPQRQRRRGGLASLLRDPGFRRFLLAAFLMQASHAPFYGFFTLLLDARGYSGAAIGGLWSIGVIAEIALFATAHRLLARAGLREILLGSLLLAALRWLMIGVGAAWVLVLVLAQCLHAATFGSFHAASIEFVRRRAGEADQGQGQALYSAVSFGAGGALGALCSGWLWEFDQRLVFVLAALAALAGWWVLRSGADECGLQRPGGVGVA